MLAALTMVALWPASGCTTETEPGECIGGKRDANLNCVAICDPAKCLENNVCVDNTCRLECTGHYDCIDELQECVEAVTDQREPVYVCKDTGRARVNFYLGMGVPCPTGRECDFWTCDGNVVCGDASSPACLAPGCNPRPVQYCGNGNQCDFHSCGGDPAQCVKACEGESCNIGRCNGTGAGCVFNTCAEAECKPMQCRRPNGTTVTPGQAGEGDADAFCTFPDCADDAACGPGYYCGKIRDSSEICGKDVDADVLLASPCGTPPSGAPCVDPTAFTANGGTYFEGPVCLMRSVCRLRDECAPCETSLDCSKGLGDVCVSFGGQNVCARWCNGDGDCRPDEACSYSGQDNTGYVCLARTGSCRATTAMASKFCYRCVDDTDCGDASGAWACRSSEGGPACVSLDLPDTCATASDCPLAPSMARGDCLDEDPGNVVMTDPAYHRCFVPHFATTRFSCWP